MHSENSLAQQLVITKSLIPDSKSCLDTYRTWSSSWTYLLRGLEMLDNVMLLRDNSGVVLVIEDRNGEAKRKERI